MSMIPVIDLAIMSPCGMTLIVIAPHPEGGLNDGLYGRHSERMVHWVMCSVIKQYWPVMTTSDKTILFHDKKLSLLLMELNIKETKVEHSVVGDCLLVRGCCFVIVPV